jgi:mono/diheme cytochrome c family protein
MRKHRLVAAVVLLALALLVPLALRAGEGAADEAQPAADAARIERGSYLVSILGCNDCHTPWKMGENGPEPDMTRMLSGHPQDIVITAGARAPEAPWDTTVSSTFTAWSGGFGVSFTRNLTPDDETGLGTWTEREFIDTIRNGRSRGIGRELLPPMPWPAYRNATDEDLAAIFAYLQSIPAVSNRVPDPLPPPAAAPAE